jgi:hypothetical protein
LENPSEQEAAWNDLWNELHHQGDVGDASYVAVPLLVEAHRKRGMPDWNTYAIVCTIELARTAEHNPKLPAWLSEYYFQAIQDLAKIGIRELALTDDFESVRAIMAIIALAKGIRTHAKFLVEYTDSELQEIASRNFA